VETGFGRPANTPVWFHAVALIAVLRNAAGPFDHVMTRCRVEAYVASLP